MRAATACKCTETATCSKGAEGTRRRCCQAHLSPKQNNDLSVVCCCGLSWGSNSQYLGGSLPDALPGASSLQRFITSLAVSAGFLGGHASAVKGSQHGHSRACPRLASVCFRRFPQHVMSPFSQADGYNGTRLPLREARGRQQARRVAFGSGFALARAWRCPAGYRTST